MKRSRIPVYLSVFSLLGLLSCKTPSARLERFYGTLMEAKQESLTEWKDRPLLEFTGLRTAIIVDGSDGLIMTNSAVTAEGNFRLSYRIEKETANTMQIGSAVPITSDGYYLTARHCIDGDSNQLFTLAREADRLTMVKRDFRTVWSSGKDQDFDLALIKAEVAPFHPFNPVSPDSIPRATRIGTSGWSALTIGDSNPLAGMATGKILNIRPFASTAPELKGSLIFHSAPLHPGDSGGPIVNEKGQLIGINAQVQISPMESIRSLFQKRRIPRPVKGYIGIGSFPDIEMLFSWIERDRQQATPTPGS